MAAASPAVEPDCRALGGGVRAAAAGAGASLIRPAPPASSCSCPLHFLAHLLPPLGGETGARHRIALGGEIGGAHAVGAEAAERLAQFAPRDHDPHHVPVADRDRPDQALAFAALFVAIGDADLGLGVDRG